MSHPAGNDHAQVIAPPPLIAAAAALAGLGLRWAWPARVWPWGSAQIPAAVCLTAALAVSASAAVCFWRARTTFLPHRPAAALLTSGSFRVTRNPLYLSMGLLLAGLAFALNSLAMLAVIAPWVLVMRHGVIAREERYLEGRFGEAYRAYCRRVRRWL